MKYDTAGEYSITYTATDECGNETTETRIIEVKEITLSTVLFADGRLIVNERSNQRNSNIEEHGEVVKEYVPLDENNTYNFTTASQRPWNAEIESIKTVSFGDIAPVSIAYWLQNATNLEGIYWGSFKGDKVTTARGFVANTNIKDLALPSMNMLSNIRYICNSCHELTYVSFAKVGTGNLKDTVDAFQGCYKLTEVDLSGVAGTIETCDRMFANVNSDGMGNMTVKTIYASEKLDFSQATSSANMFRTCTSIVGGNGTTFDSTKINNAYARIDEAGQPGYFTAK